METLEEINNLGPHLEHLDARTRFNLGCRYEQSEKYFLATMCFASAGESGVAEGYYRLAAILHCNLIPEEVGGSSNRSKASTYLQLADVFGHPSAFRMLPGFENSCKRAPYEREDRVVTPSPKRRRLNPL